MHRSAVLKRCDDLLTHLPSYDAHPLKFATLDALMYFLPPGGSRIFAEEITVKTCFIDIDSLILGDILDLLLVIRYLLWRLLLIASRLFFRVIFRRLRA